MGRSSLMFALAAALLVLLVVTQQTISSTTIYTTTDTPTDADVIHAIDQAHRLRLKVMLKPHLDPIDDPGAWCGMIGQGFTPEKNNPSLAELK